MQGTRDPHDPKSHPALTQPNKPNPTKLPPVGSPFRREGHSQPEPNRDGVSRVKPTASLPNPNSGGRGCSARNNKLVPQQQEIQDLLTRRNSVTHECDRSHATVVLESSLDIANQMPESHRTTHYARTQHKGPPQGTGVKMKPDLTDVLEVIAWVIACLILAGLTTYFGFVTGS